MDIQSALHAEGPWEHHTIHARGIGFHAVIAGDEPTRHTVILLHDFPMHWWSWRYQIETLARMGYRVIALDLRGMGASDLQPGPTELEELAQDVVAVAGATGTSSYSVVGTGLGGSVAWMLAHMDPPDLQSVVVINADYPGARSVSVGSRAVPESRFTTRKLMDGSLVETLLVEGAAPASRDHMAEVSVAYEVPLRRVFAAQAALETRKAARHPSSAAKKVLERPIEVPVLVVEAEEDSFRSGRQRRKTQERQGVSPTTISGSGHYPNEEAPEELNAILIEHLESVKGPDQR